MKKRICVPQEYEDITKALSHRRRTVFVKCGIWCGVMCLLWYVYLWDYFAARLGVVGSALIAAVLFVLYPLKAGIVRQLTDVGWEGTVRDVKKKSYIHFKNFWSRSYTGMTTRIEGHLYLHGREGRAAVLERFLPIRHRFILRDGGAELPYLARDHVRCYCGCAYPVIVLRPGDDGYPPRVCVFCGKTEEDRERVVCDFCGYSLITPTETVRHVEYGL